MILFANVSLYIFPNTGSTSFNWLYHILDVIIYLLIVTTNSFHINAAVVCY